MTKVSYKKIKSDRQKIIMMLRKNGDLKMSDIAKMLKMTRQTFWRHMKYLQRHGLILQSTMIVAPNALDVERFIIGYHVQPGYTNDPWNIPMLEQVLDEFNVSIVSCFHCHGHYDWIMHVEAPDLITVKKAVDRLSHKSNGMIKDAQIDQVLQTVMDGFQHIPFC